MSELRRYPDYKDSGVPWLGEIPSHWEVIDNKYLFNFSRGLTITKANLVDEGIPCINYGEVHSKYGFEVDPKIHKLKCVPKEYVEKFDYALLNRGDFIFADTSEDYKGSGNFTYLNSDEMTFAGYHTVVARLKTDDDPRFMAYLFDSNEFRTQVKTRVSGVKVFSITHNILKNVFVWIPSKSEQQAIVNFLDDKLNHIDTLISKQQQLIEKLAEQRSAVITHAVTKGLNPDVPMKDSGVEWLGEIPEHWELTYNKYLFNFSRGLTITKADLIDEGIPCVNYGEVHSKYGFEVDPNIHPLKCVPESYAENFKYAVLKEGDFVFADTSEDYKGSGNFTHLNSKTLTMAGYHTVVMKQKHDHNHRYLAYMFDSKVFRTQIINRVSGVKVFSVTQGILKRIPAWLPPLTEQNNIVIYLDEQVNRMDRSSEAAKDIITKLQEYRAALITQAVTGKIDVRHLNQRAS